jgi:DNA-binding CsgD family transcriptional regulator
LSFWAVRVVAGDPGLGLIGRANECEVLDRLVADVRAHHSGVVVLRGEAGVGKSALVDRVARTSAGCRVVRAAGVEMEMELPFAAVHQLCAGMLERIDDLPGPQRDALGTAFGLVERDPADRFLVSLAVLSLMSAVAEDRPLVCLVDDAQWLDRASAQTLAFVARRLLAESVALLFAVREPSDETELHGLPELTIDGLPANDARALLESASLERLDDRVRDRIVAETRGNPLALLELPRGMKVGELAGGFALPRTRTLTSRIEQSFVQRVEALPEQTQQLLLVAAAEPLGDAVLLHRAAQRLGIGIDADAPAEEDGLIEFEPRVRFRHPLVRSAAYRLGSPALRRAAHHALAEVTDDEADPDRRAWHRAHAAAQPDEDVAADLERCAARARERGGVAAAAAFLERAVALTPDAAQRSHRALVAAQAKFETAAYDAAEALIATAELGPHDDLSRAQTARLRAEVVFARTRGRDAPPLLLDAARSLEPLDGRLARGTYLEALTAALFAGGLCTEPTLQDVAQAARRGPPASSPPTSSDLLLDGVATRFTEGYRAAVAPLRTALDAFTRGAASADTDNTRWFSLAWLVAEELWDDEQMEDLATRAVRAARDAGTLADLPIALVYRAGAHVHAGQFAAADVLAEEAAGIAAATGYAALGYASILLAAWRGDDATYQKMLAWAMPNATARGEGRALGQAGWFSAILDNGHGRYDAALAGARDACQHDTLGFRGLALTELIEAAARTGDLTAATNALVELEERTVAAGSDWALGTLTRCRALLAPNEGADALYREAIERLERTKTVVHAARTRLLYGEWLRRRNRRLDARDQLKAAYEALHEMGAEAFAERARRELVASGATARKRNSSNRTALSPQEAQIAQLAADGHTNQEIGSELFISPRTVEYHLSKVFTKLDLTTRRELRTAARQLG